MWHKGLKRSTHI